VTGKLSTASTRTGWEPLLSGELSRLAEAVVEEISEAVHSRTWPDARVSVANGAAGLALLYTYLALVTGDARDEERAVHHLDQAIEGAVAAIGPSLFDGVAGVGWAAEHISSALDVGDPDPHGAVDDALVALLERAEERCDCDLAAGLAGLAVYALERLPRPAARICLELAVERLEQQAETTAVGLAWHTPPELLPAHELEQAPEGYYNLGVAHGVPGLLPPLAAAAAAGVARAHRLLEAAVSWLSTQRLAGDGGSCFPFWVVPGRAPAPARSAWCYGDPGVAGALLAAARVSHVRAWEQDALAIARRAAARPPE
jgi:class I lanthipeptide synthase